ncbi:MAG: cobyric acid synthase [Candidatus Limiplasma sp.]|nr:cobyric acid synthase [Candidatus Limiplasma sp.]
MAKTIMIQGTMSNAGKSVIAAGLCRIFMQDGLRVAPFKAQNMALNSFITKEGLEMGRAQVVQAEAAGIEPSALMNPILLKPTNDTGSQVIVNGEVWGQMTAREYFAVKKQLLPDVMRAFDKLAGGNDVIVIEGAGSPAEINLKDDDCFVNMGMAKAAKAPVLLVGDIDRGGVFAQLWGTVALLDPDERALVKGIIINKFRGDESILTPGVKKLEQLLGLPVVGVVPYIHLDIDDEDSLSERLVNKAASLVDIAVVRLPRLSNFTDFKALEGVDGVSLRYVSTVGQVGEPDLIILPGTKNTMQDLLWLRQNGLEAKIKGYVAACGAVFGICGGYQMLGEQLSDPYDVEGGGSVRGMGLLPVSTVFTPQKTRTRVSGRFAAIGGMLGELAGKAFEGYEIHMGETSSAAAIAELTDSATRAVRADGCQKGSVYGCYVHGVFDSDNIAGTMIRALACHKGIDPAKLGKVSGEEHKQQQYNLLADTLRKHADIAAIYKILEEGIQ